jgi:hypothetical protein
MTSPATRRDRATVRFDAKETGGLFFGDQLRSDNGNGDIVAHVNDLTQRSATDLLRAIRRRGDFASGTSGTLLVSEVDTAFFDEEESVVAPIYFERLDDSLTLVIDYFVDHFDDEEGQSDLIRQTLAPMLQRQRMTPLEAWPDLYWGAPPWLWHARIGFSTRSRTLDELFEVGRDAIALMDAIRGGPLTRQTVGDLVRSGHARVLIGQPEGHWLDVKGQHYNLETDHGQISLAQSVTRFCNSEAGGLVIVGIITKRVPGGEDIRGINPLPRNDKMLRRYQQTLEKRVFPPPDNLSVESIHIGSDEMLMLIDVPPQPEELKPFLVHGAIVDGRIEGSFISIIRRRGESSIPITAPMIHSTLAAGRALLRRGELPPSAESREDNLS